MSHGIDKIRLEPRVWHSIMVIAYLTVPVQVETNWKSERPYAFVRSLQCNLIRYGLATYVRRSSTMEPSATKY